MLTDADGSAVISFTLPDNLTSYRIWAVATTEAEFGFVESSMKAQLPLMVNFFVCFLVGGGGGWLAACVVSSYLPCDSQ